MNFEGQNEHVANNNNEGFTTREASFGKVQEAFEYSILDCTKANHVEVSLESGQSGDEVSVRVSYPNQLPDVLVSFPIEGENGLADLLMLAESRAQMIQFFGQTASSGYDGGKDENQAFFDDERDKAA